MRLKLLMLQYSTRTHAALLVLPQTTKCLVFLACLKCNVIHFDDIQKSILENHLNVTTQILTPLIIFPTMTTTACPWGHPVSSFFPVCSTPVITVPCTQPPYQLSIQVQCKVSSNAFMTSFISSPGLILRVTLLREDLNLLLSSLLWSA